MTSEKAERAVERRQVEGSMEVVKEGHPWLAKLWAMRKEAATQVSEREKWEAPE
jgi:hypothetical protein